VSDFQIVYAGLMTDIPTKGTLMVGLSSGLFRFLPVGNNGFVLTADSALDIGVKWSSKSGGAGSEVTLDVQEFTTAGSHTWTKPAGAVSCDIMVIGPGGGGGSGRRGASGTIRGGGGGATGGGIARARMYASDLDATEDVVVGAGGAGGTAITSDNTNGNSGTTGLGSSFGNIASGWRRVVVSGGTRGGDGSSAVDSGNAGSPPPPSYSEFPMTWGSRGGSATASPFDAALSSASVSPGGGGGGRGISSTNVERAGSEGGAGGNVRHGPNGGAAGTSGAGVAGGAAPADALRWGAGGGGGGGIASVGGAGGYPGGGGAGGGGSTNGTSSGAGGAGAPGYVCIVTLCVN